MGFMALFSTSKNGFCLISFEKIIRKIIIKKIFSVLDSCFIHRYIIIKLGVHFFNVEK